MGEVIVELIEKYFVEVDSLNHTLKKRYIGKDKKTGEDKPLEKIIGYYQNMQQCVERLVRLIPLDENNNTTITLREYAEASEHAFKRVEGMAVEWKNNGRWIPCSERYPDTTEYILLSFSNFSIPVGGRWEEDANGGAFYVGDESESCISQDLYVNAWMPLPEPYKGE